MDPYIISFNFNCIMQLKQFWNIVTKVSSRKKCYYLWWSPWLIIAPMPVKQPWRTCRVQQNKWSPHSVCIFLRILLLLQVPTQYMHNHVMHTITSDGNLIFNVTYIAWFYTWIGVNGHCLPMEPIVTEVNSRPNDCNVAPLSQSQLQQGMYTGIGACIQV